MKKAILCVLLACAMPAFAEDITKGSFWQLQDGGKHVVLQSPLPEAIIKEKAWFYLDDGRVCKGCTAYRNLADKDEPVLLVDKKGNKVPGYGGRIIGAIKHPYAKQYAQGAALGMMSAGQALQRNAAQQNQLLMQQQMAPPRTWNCNTYGNMTNCNGY